MSRTVEIVLTDEILPQLERVSQVSHETEEKVILKAIRSYLSIFSEDLMKEIRAWDRLSDETLIEFEKSIG